MRLCRRRPPWPGQSFDAAAASAPVTTYVPFKALPERKHARGRLRASCSVRWPIHQVLLPACARCSLKMAEGAWRTVAAKNLLSRDEATDLGEAPGDCLASTRLPRPYGGWLPGTPRPELVAIVECHHFREVLLNPAGIASAAGSGIGAGGLGCWGIARRFGVVDGSEPRDGRSSPHRQGEAGSARVARPRRCCAGAALAAGSHWVAPEAAHRSRWPPVFFFFGHWPSQPPRRAGHSLARRAHT